MVASPRPGAAARQCSSALSNRVTTCWCSNAGGFTNSSPLTSSACRYSSGRSRNSCHVRPVMTGRGVSVNARIAMHRISAPPGIRRRAWTTASGPACVNASVLWTITARQEPRLDLSAVYDLADDPAGPRQLGRHGLPVVERLLDLVVTQTGHHAQGRRDAPAHAGELPGEPLHVDRAPAD